MGLKRVEREKKRKSTKKNDGLGSSTRVAFSTRKSARAAAKDATTRRARRREARRARAGRARVDLRASIRARGRGDATRGRARATRDSIRATRDGVIRRGVDARARGTRRRDSREEARARVRLSLRASRSSRHR